MKRIHLLPVAVLLSGALAGCAQGVNANTTIQDETGNGIVIEVGSMTVASATVVAGEEGERGAISAVVVNDSADEETLEAIVVDGVSAELTPSPVVIEPGTSVQISSLGEVQAEFDLDAMAGEFVEAQFTFSASGIGSELVLVVPAIGYYEQFAPGGATGGPAVEEAEAAEEGAEADTEAEEGAEEDSDAAAVEGEEAPASE